MWFRKAPTYDWEKEFTESVRRVFDDETWSFDQAATALRGADGRRLLDYSDRGRRWTSAQLQLTYRDHSRAMLKNAWRLPEHADLYLFFESCSRNGYIREQATRALRSYPGRLACAAALIRCEDWVDNVAGTARALLEDLGRTEAATHLFELLDLVVALGAKQRFTRRWQDTIEPVLLDPRWREARRRALSHPHSSVRLLVHQLIARADPDLLEESLIAGLADPAPKIAHDALERTRALPVETRRAMLRKGMRHAVGSTRSSALRQYAQEGFDDARDVLIAALLDRHSSVRGAAAYILEHEFAVAALPLWRAAFDAGRNRETLTRTLAESGDATDIERLRSQLDHKRGRVRAAALQGVLRIGVNDSAALATHALRDPSSAVARAAARAYSRGNETLDDVTLRAAFDATGDERLRARYISFSSLLSKWLRLEFLLESYRKTSSTGWHQIDSQINEWMDKANRSYVQPGEERRQQLMLTIDDLSRSHPTPFWKRLRHLL